MFTTSFDAFVCEGESITCEVDGFKLTARIYTDDNSSPPWERHCGHGPVSDWTSRNKRPGERILNTYHNSHRFYDFAEAVKIARADRWGVEAGKRDGETDGAYAARAVEHDLAVLKAWYNDEWYYVGVAVTVSKKSK
jgi:hypothetical protein